ncbi:hypothetical protein AYO45_05370 [Gammaproteobacteria bacterium SCGC AG-212-F23]|nr:hypothetical protein AYO45_05370 [Gammaproteobacteria bacterium SCGC AG-212-F23]
MKFKFFLITLLFIISGSTGFFLYIITHRDNIVEPTYERQTFHYPATFVKQLHGDPEAGKKIFTEYCSTCHGVPPKIAVHAPSIADKNYWNALKKLGLPYLLNNTITGKGAMPARGGCFECSDEQLRETIKYILKTSSP